MILILTLDHARPQELRPGREASYLATHRRCSRSVVNTVSVTEAGGDGIITKEDEANFFSGRVLSLNRSTDALRQTLAGAPQTWLLAGGGGNGAGGNEVTPDGTHSPSGSGVFVCRGGRGRLGPEVLVMTGPSVSSPITDSQISRYVRTESS